MEVEVKNCGLDETERKVRTKLLIRHSFHLIFLMSALHISTLRFSMGSTCWKKSLVDLSRPMALITMLATVLLSLALNILPISALAGLETIGIKNTRIDNGNATSAVIIDPLAKSMDIPAITSTSPILVHTITATG
jgi:hypothetical protein